ncbi:TonB-dependent siderophore receptor [Bordetella petrii]|uniref:TonB-dependent siderophore receptor n=1 Tax=Bordetella petrii TaxID=94624 RepID=UPI001E539479|nr:TonB-dependent receptor [Bordetella petrii]MCD0502708.1 TonB-dependent receptor [Bordetella petrii]
MRARVLLLTPLAIGAGTLAGTAIAAEETAPATLAPVVVQGSSDANAATTPVATGALGSRSALNTPFSVRSVGAEDIADRQVTSLGQVFARESSVIAAGNSYNSRPSTLVVRGLPLDAFNSYKIDGVSIVNYGVELPLEHFERVDLLKGATGFMYGFGSPGGIVNYITKKPTDEFLASASVGYRSDSVFSQHVDLGGRLGPDDRLGYRINYTHEQGGTYNHGDIDRNSFSAALDLRLTPDLLWTFEGMYQDRDTSGTVQAISLGPLFKGSGVPDTISGRTRLSTEGSGYRAVSKFAKTGLQWAFAPQWTASVSYSYSQAVRTYKEETLNLLNDAGDYLDNMYDQKNAYRFNQLEAMVQGQFTTGFLKHEVVLGASTQTQVNDFNTNSFYGPIGTGNIFNGTRPSPYTGSLSPEMYRGTEYRQNALYASDTIQFGEHWSLLAGVRYIDYRQRDFDPSGVRESEYKKHPVTPTVALMYKPRHDTTLYASYVEALEQGATVGSQYANAGAVLAPLESKQYEIGVKTAQEDWGASAALFRIERGASYVNDANEYVQDGEGRLQGLELAGNARLARDWSVLANAMWLDPKYRTGNPSLEGKRLPGAARFVASGQVVYNVPAAPGLSLAAGMKYVGASKLDSANQLELPSYYTLDLGAVYRTRILDKGVVLRAAIDNLTDRRYWYSVGTNSILPAPSRTVSLNAQVYF